MRRVQQHKFIDLAKPAEKRADEPGGMSRRSFLAAATAVAGVTSMSSTAFARNFGKHAEPVRYPEPDVVGLDSRFKYKLGNTPIMRLYKGTLWAEGPAAPLDRGRRPRVAAFPLAVGQLERQHLRLQRAPDRV
jgi:gluconolactonase